MNGTTSYSSDVKIDNQKRKMFREAKKARLQRKKLRQQVPVVTIPGFKGSVLEKEDGTVVWLTAAQVFQYFFFLINFYLFMVNIRINKELIKSN
jgi:hypothetical protein